MIFFSAVSFILFLKISIDNIYIYNCLFFSKKVLAKLRRIMSRHIKLRHGPEMVL